MYLKIRCVDFRRHCRIHRFCRRCASFRRSRIQALAEILRLLSSGFRGLSLDILARGSPPLAKRHRLRVFRQTLRCALRQRAMAPFLARVPHPSVERARKGKPLRTRENFRRGANSSSRLARRRRPRRERASEFVTHEGEEKPFAPRHAVAPEFCAEILRLLSSGFRGLSLDILARGSPPLAKRHRLRVFRQTLRCALRQRAKAPFLAHAPHPSVERARKDKPLRTRESFLRGFSEKGGFCLRGVLRRLRRTRQLRRRRVKTFAKIRRALLRFCHLFLRGFRRRRRDCRRVFELFAKARRLFPRGFRR